MPGRGRPPGMGKTGGRKKGVPNKITSATREAFLAVFEKFRTAGDLERWIRETGDGFQAVHFLHDGTAIPYTEKSPGKAAELLLKYAEFCHPKLGRVELAGQDGGALTVVINKLPPNA